MYFYRTLRHLREPSLPGDGGRRPFRHRVPAPPLRPTFAPPTDLRSADPVMRGCQESTTPPGSRGRLGTAIRGSSPCCDPRLPSGKPPACAETPPMNCALAVRQCPAKPGRRLEREGETLNCYVPRNGFGREVGRTSLIVCCGNGKRMRRVNGHDRPLLVSSAGGAFLAYSRARARRSLGIPRISCCSSSVSSASSLAPLNAPA